MKLEGYAQNFDGVVAVFSADNGPPVALTEEALAAKLEQGNASLEEVQVYSQALEGMFEAMANNDRLQKIDTARDFVTEEGIRLGGPLRDVEELDAAEEADNGMIIKMDAPPLSFPGMKL